jgi:biopolymer transport protein TolR
MSMQLGTSNGPRCEINVTPMIDLLLVLIIIFMIITPHTGGLRVAVPHENHETFPKPPSIDPTIIVRVIHGDGNTMSVKINQDDVSWQDLASRLTDIYKTRAERIMFVSADADVEFAQVMRVIDISQGTKQDIRVGLISSKTNTMGD